MNNPYRARQTRSRVDHTSMSGYGALNQNAWGPTPSRVQAGVPPSNAFQQQSHAVGQQQRQSDDAWNWGSDNVNNGNDSWNWSVDQQPESQQQQQHQQQQQQFVPSYANNGQAVPNSVQENYYQNLNGNNRPNLLNQHSTSGRTTPRIGTSRESTPNHSDPYPRYTNYSLNQQYPVPPGPSSKSNSILTVADRSQWSKDQQSQSIPYTQQKPPVQNQQNQAPPPPPLVNSYNWSNVDQQNIPLQHNWQNHSEGPASGYWHNSNLRKEEQHVESVGNQWQPQEVRHSQIPQTFAPAQNATIGEHSMNSINQQPEYNASNSWTNPGIAASSQWLDRNSESAMPTRWQQPVQNFQPTSVDKPESIASSHQWQQANVQHDVRSNQRMQETTETSGGFAVPEKSIQQESSLSKISANDCQQIQPPPSHFASSSGSTMSGSILNIPNSVERQEEGKGSVIPPVTNSTPSSDFPIQSNTIARSTVTGDRQNWAVSSEINLSSNNSENILARDNAKPDWNADDKQISTCELSSGFGQMSLGDKSDKSMENQMPQHDIRSSVHPTDDWSSQTISGSCAVDSNTSENVSVLQSKQVDSAESAYSVGVQSNVTQEQLLPQTYQPGHVNVAENISQTGYDQWYNRSAVPEHSENGWYSKDHVRPPKQWPSEQNVENYENIQQPSEFINLEVVAPVLQERDIYGSRDSINRETLDNDPKLVTNPPKEAAGSRDFRQQAISNVEVPTTQQSRQSLQVEQTPDNYEFASNDRNTFLETGELTDSHQEHEPTPPSQDDENDEVPNDIPFLREVPGQSSSADPRRNDPTGQEQYVQASLRVSDPRRNDPSGQEQNVQGRIIIPDRTERRDVPPGQERIVPSLPRVDTDTLERRNDPSGRERSLPPQQSRNDPSGEERVQSSQQQIISESTETREVLGRGNEIEESVPQADSGLRQIPGGVSPNEAVQKSDDRSDTRVVTGSQEVATLVSLAMMQDQSNETRNKREEAVGASTGENQGVSGVSNRRDSYEDGDDEGSGNSRDESRERRRDGSSDQRRYDYDRKGRFYDRDRDYDEDYYYDRRRGGDYDRAYNSREDLDHREAPYRDDDRRHQNRDELERRGREDVDRRGRSKDDLDDRDGRRRIDDRRRDKGDDPRRRDRERDFESRFPRDREYSDRDKRREDRRGRRYDDYDPRDSLRREYYDDTYGRNSRPSSRSSYNDRDRDYYLRARDPYYGYNGYGGYDYGANYNSNYYAYLENLRRTNPAAYSEWYHKYYASQQQQQQASRGVASYPEDRASVHSGRSSCNDRFFPNTSICFHSPNKSLYVSYFGSSGLTRGSVQKRNMTYRNMYRTTTDKHTLGDMSVIEDSTIVSARLTPTKFSTSHVYGSFALGSLLHVHASYPADGERAKVDILRVDSLLQHDSVARELRAYPGPLIKQVGVTHKKTIIEYCDSKIKKAATNEEMDDRASYILLYELMIMLIQQNGNVVGVDIATLLLMNKDAYPYDANKQQYVSIRRESIMSQRSVGKSVDGNVGDTATPHERDEGTKLQRPLSIEQITDEFRNTLLYGLVQEALEYAMAEGLWGHALFLASKLDKRTHASVMTRFANSLPANDPLQTLYQLHSGRVPASVTCVADPKWDDWRPHLAMIISNTSANPEINRKSITTLGDTLAARGNINGAHFCYILAQVDFGSYGNGTNNKLVLIGSNHHKSYLEFVTTEAIMLTEIYEYARNLSEPGFALVDLQTFKFELAVKMVDCGLMEKALLYIEQIAMNIANEPSKYKKSFIDEVYTLGDRIKYYDPVCKDSVEDAANLAWLNNLAEVVGKCQTGEIVQDDIYGSRPATDLRGIAQNQEHHEIQQQQQQNWIATQPDYSDGPSSLMDGPSMEVQTDWQPLSLPTNVQDPYNLTSQNAKYMENCIDTNQTQQQSQQQQGYWGQQSYNQQDYKSQDYVQAEWQQHSKQAQYPTVPMDSEITDNTQQQNKWNYESEKEEISTTPEPQPKISMTPSSTKQYDPLEELDALDMPNQTSKLTAENNKKAPEKSSEKKNSGGGGGSWFGGLFSKLAPKPKNQMILPDDNNPTIIWDPIAKKWMNKDEGTEASSTKLAPPPKVPAMEFRLPSVEPTANSMSTTQPIVQSEESIATANSSNLLTGSNMYKLPKVRSMRANYIDVMNPSGTKNTGTPSLSTPVTSPLVPIAASSPQLFVPAPVNDPNAPVDFLTPIQTIPISENVPQGLSRWSSTSSLSREVQSYTMRDPRLLLRDKGPMMFNPADMKDHSSKNTPRNRYPPQ